MCGFRPCIAGQASTLHIQCKLIWTRGACVLLLQTSHVKTENSFEFVDLLYIVVYILDEIKFSFTEFSFTDE